MNFNFIAEAQVRLNRFMCLNLVSLQDKKAKQTAMQTVKYDYVYIVYSQNIYAFIFSATERQKMVSLQFSLAIVVEGVMQSHGTLTSNQNQVQWGTQ